MSFSTLLPGGHPVGLDFNLLTNIQSNFILSSIPEHEELDGNEDLVTGGSEDFYSGGGEGKGAEREKGAPPEKKFPETRKFLARKLSGIILPDYKDLPDDYSPSHRPKTFENKFKRRGSDGKGGSKATSIKAVIAAQKREQRGGSSSSRGV